MLVPWSKDGPETLRSEESDRGYVGTDDGMGVLLFLGRMRMRWQLEGLCASNGGEYESQACCRLYVGLWRLDRSASMQLGRLTCELLYLIQQILFRHHRRNSNMKKKKLQQEQRSITNFSSDRYRFPWNWKEK